MDKEVILEISEFSKKRKWTKEELLHFLANADHESMGFTKLKEMSYTPKRAYQVFPRRFGNLQYATGIFNSYGENGLFEVMYGNRKDLGNVNPGDGAKFIGRGPIMITGRDNYTWCAKELKLDLLNNPSILENVKEGTMASMLWWERFVRPKIKKFDESKDSFDSVIKAVNGEAMLGYSDRVNKYFKWKKVLE